MNYEQMLDQLYARGWKPGDPIPEDLINASNDVSVAGGLPPPPQAGTQAPPVAAPPIAPTAPQAGGMDPSIYENMSDEDAQMYAGMGELGKQRAFAESLRDTPALEGRYVNQGRTYVGDSPIAHIVRGAQIYKGKKDVKKLGGEQTKGRKSIIDLLRKKELTKEEEEEVSSIIGAL